MDGKLWLRDGMLQSVSMACKNRWTGCVKSAMCECILVCVCVYVLCVCLSVCFYSLHSNLATLQEVVLFMFEQ